MQPATMLGAMMIAACWLGLGYILSIEQSKSVAGATQQAENFARLFEENTVRTFEGIDRGLLLLREAYERDPAHFDLNEWSKQATLLAAPTFELTVIGADGFAVVTTIPGVGNVFEPFYVGDREHFLAQVDAKTDELFISSPVTGRFSHKWSIQVSRRLRHPEGSFAGVVVASLDPGSIDRFFETVDLGPQGSVLLRRLDGVILASNGLKQVVGSQVMLPELRGALALGPSGHFWGSGAVDGVIRLVAYQATKGFPALVLVGLAEGYIFESYWRNRATYITIMSIITGLVLIAMMAAIRHQMRIDHIRDDLSRSEAQARQQARELELKTRELEVTLDHMAQGIIMTDTDNHVPVINRKAVELLGLPDSFRSSDNATMLGLEASDLLAQVAPQTQVYQRATADGAVLEIHQTSLPNGGAVRTITESRCADRPCQPQPAAP
jgi:PAS domain-containing protein